MIIDCLMNLLLFYFVIEVIGDEDYKIVVYSYVK